MPKTPLQYTLAIRLPAIRKGDTFLYVGLDGVVEYHVATKVSRSTERITTEEGLTVNMFYCLPYFAAAHNLLVDQLVAYRMDRLHAEEAQRRAERVKAWAKYQQAIGEVHAPYHVQDHGTQDRWSFGPLQRADAPWVRSFMELDLSHQWNGLPRAETISWSSFGAVTPAMAKRFAMELLDVVARAEDHQREVAFNIIAKYPELKEQS